MSKGPSLLIEQFFAEHRRLKREQALRDIKAMLAFNPQKEYRVIFFEEKEKRDGSEWSRYKK